MLQSGRSRSPARPRVQRIYFNDFFRLGQPNVRTITSRLQGTSAYINGTLISTARGFQLASRNCAGRFERADNVNGSQALQYMDEGGAAGDSRGRPRGCLYTCSTSIPATWSIATLALMSIWIGAALHYPARGTWICKGESKQTIRVLIELPQNSLPKLGPLFCEVAVSKCKDFLTYRVNSGI